MNASTLLSSTSHSTVDYQLSARAIVLGRFIATGLAVGGIVAEPWHRAERDCQPRVDLCSQADKMFLPDGRDGDPSNPLGSGRIVATANSTSATVALTPSNVIIRTK